MTPDPFTPAGEVEGLGRFFAGLRRAQGWRRTAGIALLVMFAIPVVLGVAQAIARAIH